MIAVIIAGGSGTRLWPLSTHDYPKQLLKINGDDRSLLQKTYARAQSMAEIVYVMPEARLTGHIRDQLPELTDDRLIVEPALRGTAGCVVTALAHIAETHDHDEPIAFLWSDHHIRDAEGFAHSFQVASSVSQAEDRIVLVGVEPDYPATGFGYIEKGALSNEQNSTYDVQSFKEKPEHKLAQEYFRSGRYLWNTGYSVGSVNTFVQSMQANAPALFEQYQKLSAAASPQEYQDTYLSFENVSIDYALIEKVQDLLVVPASFDWMDLGSFGDLHKAADHDEQENYTQGAVEIEEVTNSFIENHEDKPVVVIGLDNVAVVNTPAGILVVPKDLSQKVGDVSKRLIQKG